MLIDLICYLYLPDRAAIIPAAEACKACVLFGYRKRGRGSNIRVESEARKGVRRVRQRKSEMAKGR